MRFICIGQARRNQDQVETPTISQFFGVSVRMYYDDHPPLHFHAYYGNQAAKIDIFALEIQEGRLPRRVLQLVLEWAALHQNELMDNWLLWRNRIRN